jgi:hypothetical protein
MRLLIIFIKKIPTWSPDSYPKSVSRKIYLTEKFVFKAHYVYRPSPRNQFFCQARGKIRACS